MRSNGVSAISNKTANSTPPQPTAFSIMTLRRSTASIVERLARKSNWVSDWSGNASQRCWCGLKVPSQIVYAAVPVSLYGPNARSSTTPIPRRAKHHLCSLLRLWPRRPLTWVYSVRLKKTLNHFLLEDGLESLCEGGLTCGTFVALHDEGDTRLSRSRLQYLFSL